MGHWLTVHCLASHSIHYSSGGGGGYSFATGLEDCNNGQDSCLWKFCSFEPPPLPEENDWEDRHPKCAVAPAATTRLPNTLSRERCDDVDDWIEHCEQIATFDS